MILYTVQPESIWIHLKTHGHFYADLNKSLFLYEDNDPFEAGIFAYRWMIKQYQQKCCHSMTTPIWAWKTYQGKTKLFKAHQNKYYFNQAMLKIDVPDDYVLLSDFEDWNICLNCGYVGTSDRDYDRFFAIEDQLSQTEYRKQVIDSWNRIFNVKDKPYVQAVIPYLDLNWVKAVQIKRKNHRPKIITLQS